MKAFNWATPAKAGQVIKLALFSDIHFDSPDCDRETLKKHLDFCLKDGRYILFNGDFFDAILLGDRKRSTPHHITNTDNQLNVKLNEAYEFLKPYQNNILFFGRGNHEESIMKYNGLDVLEMLTTMLNMGQEHKILYGNYANFLRFSFKSTGKNKSQANYDIYAHHGAGGSAPSTKGMLDFSAIIKGVNADLIWLGHKHNSLVDYSAQRFYNHTAMSGFGEVNLRLVTGNRSKGESNYAIIPDVKITTIPQMVIGKAQTAMLKQKTR